MRGAVMTGLTILPVVVALVLLAVLLFGVALDEPGRDLPHERSEP